MNIGTTIFYLIAGISLEALESPKSGSS